MPENLVQHRGEPNVWDRSDSRFSLRSCDSERWLASISAAALLFWAFKRRSRAGLALAAAGGALAWWAVMGPEERRQRRIQATAWLHRSNGDIVQEAAEESFPASDAPAWTAMTGNAERSGASF